MLLICYQHAARRTNSVQCCFAVPRRKALSNPTAWFEIQPTHSSLRRHRVAQGRSNMGLDQCGSFASKMLANQIICRRAAPRAAAGLQPGGRCGCQPIPDRQRCHFKRQDRGMWFFRGTTSTFTHQSFA